MPDSRFRKRASLVRAAGVEPARDCSQGILSPLRRPLIMRVFSRSAQNVVDTQCHSLDRSRQLMTASAIGDRHSGGHSADTADMSQKLTDAVIKTLAPPPRGNRITYDSELRGFGCRITAAGARSFVLNYRTRTGRERRYTIGQWPAWKTSAARIEAGEIKKAVDRGEDPMGEIKAGRDAPTIADLCARFEQEYLPRKRPSTQSSYRRQITADILPALRRLKVSEVSFSDIDGLHRSISKRAPYAANRVLALVSRMFTLAIHWGWCTNNPTKGIERNTEDKRHRYLWSKPGATTKQKTWHRVPLSAPARQLLVEIRNAASEGAPDAIFPGRDTEYRLDIRSDWAAICKSANIVSARVQDLRHCYASILASAGFSLPIIGALLGHTQPSTTARYSHLLDDPLRQAAERVGAVVTGKPGAEIFQLKGDRRG
jgi:integrase